MAGPASTRTRRWVERGGPPPGLAAIMSRLPRVPTAHRSQEFRGPSPGFRRGKDPRPEILLGENVLSWDYQRRARTRRAGRICEVAGPGSARCGLDLQSQARFRPPARTGSLKVTSLLGPKPEYELITSPRDRPLADPPGLGPQAGQLAASLNLRAGQVHSTGHITADQGLPRHMSVFEAVAGGRGSPLSGDLRAVGRVDGPQPEPDRSNPPGIPSWLHEPADPRLVICPDAVRRGRSLGKDLRWPAWRDCRWTWRSRDGLNLSDVLAFAPQQQVPLIS